MSNNGKNPTDRGKKNKSNKNKWVETKKVINKINKLNNWSGYNITDITKLNGDADKIAKELVAADKKKNFTNTQMRKFYNVIVKGYNKLELRKTTKSEDEFNKLRKEVTIDLNMLIPQLSYNLSRNNIDLEFVKLIDAALNKKLFRENKEDYLQDMKQFFHFMESIVAYHKYRQEANKSK